MFAHSPPRAAPSELLARVREHVRTLLGEDDPEFTQDLIDSFCTSVDSLCERIEAAAAAGDHQGIMANAHQMKGSAANVGLPRVAEDWHAIEEAARRSAPDADRRGPIQADYDGPDRRLASLQERVTESIATARHVAAQLGC